MTTPEQAKAARLVELEFKQQGCGQWRRAMAGEIVRLRAQLNTLSENTQSYAAVLNGPDSRPLGMPAVDEVPQVIVCPAHTESRYRYTRTDGNWLFAEELPPLPPLPPKL